MKSDAIRARLIKKKRGSCVNDVPTQLLPRISLREYIFRQAFGAIATVCLLNSFEDQISHAL
jgi:hypothetical protein